MVKAFRKRDSVSADQEGPDIVGSSSLGSTAEVCCIGKDGK